jgi:hypothetical protein
MFPCLSFAADLSLPFAAAAAATSLVAAARYSARTE